MLIIKKQFSVHSKQSTVHGPQHKPYSLKFPTETRQSTVVCGPWTPSYNHCIFLMVHIMMASFKRLANENSSQVCKYVSLDKCHQDFNKIYENRKGNGYG